MSVVQCHYLTVAAVDHPATSPTHSFTALQLCKRGIVMSICLSVCPSVKRVHCDKTKAPSEKRSIMTNRKSPTSFPMSRRCTAYVAPKPPNLVTVHFIRQMTLALHTCGRTHTPQLHACFQTVCHTVAMLDAHSLSAVADQLVMYGTDRLKVQTSAVSTHLQ